MSLIFEYRQVLLTTASSCWSILGVLSSGVSRWKFVVEGAFLRKLDYSLHKCLRIAVAHEIPRDKVKKIH